MTSQTLGPILRQRYASQPPYPGLSYGTVRDYCDSADCFGDLATHNNDLKDAQRPWAIKAILNRLKPGARLLEVGSGEPLAASRLAALGYRVTVCDPFDGSGRGPTEFQAFQAGYPGVNFIRSLFTPEIARRYTSKFDAIFSISVLEHVPPAGMGDLFEAIRIGLAPGGYSIHAIDHVLEGVGSQFHQDHIIEILKKQEEIEGFQPEAQAVRQKFQVLCAAAQADLETFYLSPHGHNLWRGRTTYEAFPFRKCISIHSISGRPAAETASAPSNSPHLLGYVDFCDGTTIVGWAVDLKKPSERMSVDIKVNGQPYATASCEVYRQDIQLAGYGTGFNGFNYRFSPPLGGSGDAQVAICFGGTCIPLPGGNQIIRRAS